MHWVRDSWCMVASDDRVSKGLIVGSSIRLQRIRMVSPHLMAARSTNTAPAVLCILSVPP
jgi:hypothetical protein